MVQKAFIASFIVLSVLGFVNSGYLWWQHRQQKKVFVCPLDHDCSAVTESKWSSILGIRNEVLGLLFFLLMISAAILLLAGPSILGVPVSTLLVLGTSAALLFSLVLAALQAVVLKDYCFYCLISALLTLFLWLNSFLLS